MNISVKKNVMLSPPLVLEKVATSYGISMETFKKSSQGTSNEPRAVAIYLLRQLGGLSFKQIAFWFDGANIYTINAMYRRMRQKMVLYRKVKQIESSLKLIQKKKEAQTNNAMCQ